jgi:hypothetical protein
VVLPLYVLNVSVVVGEEPGLKVATQMKLVAVVGEEQH